MVRAIRIGEGSTFIGQACALCKQEFGAGDEVVICPEDGARHHLHCWQANGNKCTAYGCRGAGAVTVIADGTSAARSGTTPTDGPRPQPRVVVQEPQAPPPQSGSPRGRQRRGTPPPPPPNAQQSASKVRTLPESSLGCGQGCVLVAIAIAIVLIAIGCFGLWSIADYIMLEVLHWNYRAPAAGAVLLPQLLTALSLLL